MLLPLSQPFQLQFALRRRLLGDVRRHLAAVLDRLHYPVDQRVVEGAFPDVDYLMAVALVYPYDRCRVFPGDNQFCRIAVIEGLRGRDDGMDYRGLQ